MRLSAISLALGRGGQRTLAQRGLAACRRNSAPVLAPLPGYVFSDAAGTTPAVIDGTVACVVDSAIPLGPELCSDPTITSLSNYPVEGAPSVREIDANGNLHIVGGVNSGVYLLCDLGAGFYKIEIEYFLVSGNYIKTGFDFQSAQEKAFSTAGAWIKSSYYIAGPTGAGHFNMVGGGGSGVEFYVKSLSIKAVALIATNPATGQQPIWRKGAVVDNVSDGIGPYWLDSDTVDDKLITVAGAAYSAATVIKSIKGVGHITAHAQDISASTNWTDDNLCGLILSPAQPNAADLALMERYADWLAGV